MLVVIKKIMMCLKGYHVLTQNLKYAPKLYQLLVFKQIYKPSKLVRNLTKIFKLSTDYCNLLFHFNSILYCLPNMRPIYFFGNSKIKLKKCSTLFLNNTIIVLYRYYIVLLLYNNTVIVFM